MSKIPTQFYGVPPSEGMITRSGTVINCISSTIFINDLSITTQFVQEMKRNFDCFPIQMTRMSPRNIQGDMIFDRFLSNLDFSKRFWAEFPEERKKYSTLTLPAFIGRTMVCRNLCYNCLTIDLLLSVFTSHKSNLRLIFKAKPKNFKGHILKKLKDMEKVVEGKISEMSEGEDIACRDCVWYREKGLEIKSPITQRERLCHIKSMIRYVESPSSIQQEIFFMFASAGVPESAAKSIIAYL